ncbi:MAG: ATP-binding protein [Candidatus Bathyarchaeota archaeon]|nr:ATP-binding protein [Candidatus Bathyarchaeota archaeon]
MTASNKGQAHIATRARLMIQLGEQLITDEIAAVSELIKNSYDADATEVVLRLDNVSESNGNITIKDNGHGMSRDKVLTSWLELGTLSKARGKNLEPRVSEFGHRLYLGEKGLGRLSVHKLGYVTELVTRRINEQTETKITLDWAAFEQNERFIEEIPIEWEETEPVMFKGVKTHGTQITIKKLHQCWSKELLERVQRGVMALKSPFSDLVNFKVDIQVNDKFATQTVPPDISQLVKKATYTFEGIINEQGKITYNYRFERLDLVGLKRVKGPFSKDLRDAKQFLNDRKPECGGFKVRFYAWELLPADIKAVFGDAAIYREMIRPNTGVKVFRDGFRVLPYGNFDNDWLNMDLARVQRFEMRISRNMTIGAIEISADSNPKLMDKTDREGLIGNDAFKDFRSLIKSAITEFEAERYIDRRKLKELTGRTIESPYRATFSSSFAALSKLITDKSQMDGDTKLQANKLISEARDAFDKVLLKNEQPLLVAASIGLTYMMPTHEVRRDLHEALKLLRELVDSEEVPRESLDPVLSVLKQADTVVSGIGKLMQQSQETEVARPVKAATTACDLLRFRCQRNKIEIELTSDSTAAVKGTDRLITIMLLNFLDNSIYWLQRNKEDNRKLKIVITERDADCLIVVSDNGPGFEDDIGVLSLPFFTRKPGGMGLGLYIADRIARMNSGHLQILAQDELPGLLPGANIAIIMKKSAVNS